MVGLRFLRTQSAHSSLPPLQWGSSDRPRIVGTVNSHIASPFIYLQMIFSMTDQSIPKEMTRAGRPTSTDVEIEGSTPVCLTRLEEEFVRSPKGFTELRVRRLRLIN